MNKVFLIGNLTRDPELTETSGGIKICRFAIAVNRNYSGADGERKTDFFNCVAWRGLAETVARYTKQGLKVAVSGSIEFRNYEDSQGVKRTSVDIVVQDVEFLTPKSILGEEVNDSSAPAQRTEIKPRVIPFEDDLDLPF